LTAIVNVGDDIVLHGLTICPDLDTITYTLAGLNNEELGWGLTGETWRVMSELRELGGEAWFGLGDRDLATHLYRSERLRNGATKAEVTKELCARHGVAVELIPVTNDIFETVLDTELGPMGFQDYFVKNHHSVTVNAITFNQDNAAVSRPALDALFSSERIVIAPSNPLLSLAPLLHFPDVRAALANRRQDVVAVSPIVGGSAIKGPADRLLGEFGYAVSPVGVARYLYDHFGTIIGTWVIDEADAAYEEELVSLGYNVAVTTTMMTTPENEERLAKAVLS
jgi:LPPG:FO 2-phospho-L-lactate transferase